MRNSRKAACALMLLVMVAVVFSALPAAAEDTPLTLEWHDEVHAGTAEGMPMEKRAEGYVDQVMHPSRASRAVRNMGNRLTGNEAKAYYLLSTIIPEIAEGRRSSTVLALQVSEFVENNTLNAQALGVETLLDGNSLVPKANAAVRAMVSIETGPLLNALLGDMPYELYWFDATNEGGISINLQLGFSGTSQELTVTGTITITLNAALEFTVDNADRTVVDTSWGERALAAAAFAQNIICTNSALGDLDKLTAYKDAICDEVEYNTYAANKNIDYGNPWQLVYVFDGDMETNVVCEGYSKAFKYLCDQSSFRGNVTVGTVSGTMNGGNHMWNVVTMNNGLNYLADITNCDSGMAGAPDQLFLRGFYAADAENGCYMFQTSDSSITYVYNQEENSLYYPSELLLSGADYEGSITIIAAANGTVSADKTFAQQGETVMLDIRGTAGFILDFLTVQDESGDDVEVQNGQFTMPATPVTVTAAFREPGKPWFAGNTLLLDGVLGLDFYLGLPEGFTGEGTMTFTIEGKTQTVPLSKASDRTQDGKTYKVFPCKVHAYQMAETITAVFTYDGDQTVEKQYTVKKYLESIREGDYGGKAVALVDATWAYGSYIQPYLHGVNGTSHAQMNYDGAVDVQGAKDGAADYALQCTVLNSGYISTAQYYLVLSSATALSVEITVQDGANEEFSVILDGKPYTPGVSGNTYRVNVNNIAANNLGVPHTIVMKAGNTVVFDLKVSAISFVNTILTKASATNSEKNAMAALYHYFKAAEDYAQ